MRGTDSTREEVMTKALRLRNLARPRRSTDGLIARFALTLLAALAGVTSVYAQEQAPEVITPLRVETDHNGVNLINGKTRISPPVLAVPGAPHLRFDRVQNAAPYVNGTISGEPGGAGMSAYSVHTGGAGSESFRCPDFDPCSSITGTGSTFNGAGPFIFRQAGSGAHYLFDLEHVRTTGSNPVVVQFYASSVTYPNGETLTYLFL